MHKIRLLIVPMVATVALVGCYSESTYTASVTDTQPSISESVEEISSDSDIADLKDGINAYSEKSACVTESLEDVATESLEDADTETVEEVVELKDYERVALDFIDYIKDKDFSDAYELVNVTCPELFTVDDFEAGLYDSRFVNLIGSNYEIMIDESYENYRDASVVLVNEEDTMLLNLVSDGNDYKINLDNTGVYLTDYKLAFPLNVDAAINKVNINKYEDKTTDYRYVTIPQMGRLPKTIDMANKYFGEQRFEIEPLNLWDDLDGGYREIKFSLSGENWVGLETELKSLINNIYEIYEEKRDISELENLCYNPEMAQEILDDISDGASEYSSLSCEEVKIFEGKDNLCLTNGETGEIEVTAGITKKFVNPYGEQTKNQIIRFRVVSDCGTLKLVSYRDNDWSHNWNYLEDNQW